LTFAVLFAIGLLAAWIVTRGAHLITALGWLRAGRRGAGNRVDSGQRAGDVGPDPAAAAR
jgi:hypothetical protein